MPCEDWVDREQETVVRRVPGDQRDPGRLLQMGMGERLQHSSAQLGSAGKRVLQSV